MKQTAFISVTILAGLALAFLAPQADADVLTSHLGYSNKVMDPGKNVARIALIEAVSQCTITSSSVTMVVR